jgi:hypothetical protein
MKAKEILQNATDLIYVDRQADYGDFQDTMYQSAMLISAYLQFPVEDYQVCGILALIKLARSEQGAADKPDNFIDGSAYIAMLGELKLEGKYNV